MPKKTKKPKPKDASTDRSKSGKESLANYTLVLSIIIIPSRSHVLLSYLQRAKIVKHHPCHPDKINTGSLILT
jgi:hypothetical protein